MSDEVSHSERQRRNSNWPSAIPLDSNDSIKFSGKYITIWPAANTYFEVVGSRAITYEMPNYKCSLIVTRNGGLTLSNRLEDKAEASRRFIDDSGHDHAYINQYQRH
jgi:hypothetical protein